MLTIIVGFIHDYNGNRIRLDLPASMLPAAAADNATADIPIDDDISVRPHRMQKSSLSIYQVAVERRNLAYTPQSLDT